MSIKLATIKNTGQDNVDLDIVRFYGGDKRGVMFQITQGIGNITTPGFIQLTIKDVKLLQAKLDFILKNDL